MSRHTHNALKGFVCTLLVILSIGVFTTAIIQKVHLTQDLTGHLKRAADANSVETAKAELNTALKYLESHNMTSGYTSVLWQTPDEDIAFWYNNLKSSEQELAKVTDKTSAMEKSNLLMKLRETLMDAGDKGDDLTYPTGLARFPNNTLWGILLWGSVLSIAGVLIYLRILVD